MSLTKLHFISGSRRSGGLRKHIGLADGTNRSYPLVSKITTHEENFDTRDGGIQAYRDLLAKHAAQGHALYKGLLQKNLSNESRRGLTDKEAKTEFMVLDIDDLPTNTLLPARVDESHVKQIAEEVIKLLPKSLHQVSYVAVASSSFAMNPEKVSIHLHFLLSSPVSHRELKDWIESVNYTQLDIYNRLSLTASRMRVKSIVDPCLGEPARVVYIAPPQFGPKATNPFMLDTQRIIAVEKKVPLLNLDKALANVDADFVRKAKESKLRDLKKDCDLPTRAHKKKTLRTGNGGSTSVVIDPPPTTMYYAYDDDEFVRYNMGDKKNNAFYVHKDNPEIVYSFIPDEPPFLFRAADPQAYAEHVKKFGEAAETQKDEETGKTRKIVREMFIEQTTDLPLTVEYDRENDELIDYSIRRSIPIAVEWMKFHGRIPPDPIPPIYQVFKPDESRSIYEEDGRHYLNTFAPNTNFANRTVKETQAHMRYGNAHLLHLDCPVICDVILNMVGDCLDMFEHFINWLAYIVQYKAKAETAFFVHGEQGTGKGLFHKRIMRPLFGKYTVMNSLENLTDDKFNDWLAEVLLVFIDEFNMKATGSNLDKVASGLKNKITEPTLQLRKMQVSMYEVPFYANFIFGSNDIDAFTMHDKRRINMCPKQRRMLVARIPHLKSHSDAFDSLIEKEMDAFVHYLHNTRVNKEQAKSILINDAREEVLEASLNAVDRFFDHVEKGHFEPFIDILDKPTDHLDINQSLKLMAVKQFLIACVPTINSPDTHYIHKDDLRKLYEFLSGKEITDVRLGRMLSTQDIQVKRSDTAIGHSKKFVRRPKMVPVRWKMTDLEMLKQLQDEFNASATSITQTPQQKRDDAMRAEIEAKLGVNS